MPIATSISINASINKIFIPFIFKLSIFLYKSALQYFNSVININYRSLCNKKQHLLMNRIRYILNGFILFTCKIKKTPILNSEYKYNFKFFLILVILCIILSFLIRYNQYEKWKENSDKYFVNSIPIFTTLDAYLWARYARDFRDGSYSEIDSLRVFPFGMPRYKPMPMLSFMLGLLSSLFSKHIHIIGVYLIPILSSLFIIPLSLYMFKMGYPSAAVLGSLIGSLNGIFLIRTSIGRVDTDGLNLFFPLLTSYLIFLPYSSSSKAKIYICASFAGFTMFLFVWWYSFVQFMYLYLIILVICFYLYNVALKTIVLSSMLYFLFFSPYYLAKHLSHHYSFLPLMGYVCVFLGMFLYFYIKYHLDNYFVSIVYALFKDNKLMTAYRNHSVSKRQRIKLYIFLSIGAFVILAGLYPSVISVYKTILVDVKARGVNLFSTVIELEKNSLDSLFNSIVSPWYLALAGFIIFIVFFSFHFKELLPLVPIIILGLFVFKGSNRFVMYLAPFVGIGFGYLITIFSQILATSLSQSKERLRLIIMYISGLTGALFGVFFLTSSSAISLTDAFLGFTVSVVLYALIDKVLFKKHVIISFAIYISSLIGAFFGYYILKIYLDYVFSALLCSFIGYTLAFILMTALKDKMTKTFFKQLTVYTLTILFTAIIFKHPDIKYVSKPLLKADIYERILDLKDKLPPNPVFYSWWDNNYAVQYGLGAATYIDGGFFAGEEGIFIARGYVSSSAYELYNIAQILNNRLYILKEGTFNDYLFIDNELDVIKNKNIYILFTEDLIKIFPTLNYIGGDFDSNKKPWHVVVQNNETEDYIRVYCQRFNNGIYDCGQYELDINTGYLSAGYTLKETLYIKNGYVVKQIDYKREDGYYLEILLNEDNTMNRIYLVSPKIYSSNFNQMFHYKIMVAFL
ncbi:oligosaccharyl transferase STT3 subunit [Candidatus Magnetoovum chiemensis]|nr:oligosaccharyl transferase STT3 subunit [Candidatus Magnetoovum chiemensis]